MSKAFRLWHLCCLVRIVRYTTSPAVGLTIGACYGCGIEVSSWAGYWLVSFRALWIPITKQGVA